MKVLFGKVRERILSSAQVDRQWLSPFFNADSRVQKRFDQPGYVLKFTSNAWKKHFLILSEAIDTSNTHEGRRIPGPPISDFNTSHVHSCRRNIILLNGDMKLFDMRCSNLVIPGITQDEPSAFYIFSFAKRSMTVYQAKPGAVKKSRTFKLSSVFWNSSPQLRYNFDGEKFYISMSMALGLV